MITNKLLAARTREKNSKPSLNLRQKQNAKPSTGSISENEKFDCKYPEKPNQGVIWQRQNAEMMEARPTVLICRGADIDMFASAREYNYRTTKFISSCSCTTKFVTTSTSILDSK